MGKGFIVTRRAPEEAIVPQGKEQHPQQACQGGCARGCWLLSIREAHDRASEDWLCFYFQARPEGGQEAPRHAQARQEEARRDGGGSGGYAPQGPVNSESATFDYDSSQCSK